VTSHAAGAGSGPGARTVWQSVYSPRLALTVALFAERDGKPTRVAGLTGEYPPAEHAALEAGEVWRLAGSPGTKGPAAEALPEAKGSTERGLGARPGR
jgi:hypothetical protein